MSRDWLGGENLTSVAGVGLHVGCWGGVDGSYEMYEEKNGLLADRACYMWRGWTF